MTNNYSWGLPIGASTFAKDIDFGIYLIHYMMGLMFVLWGAFFVYLLIRYRQSRQPTVPYEKEVKWGLIPDIVVVIFEVGLIGLYAIPVWHRIKIAPPVGDAPNRIEIVAEQFAWNVHYPGPDGKMGRRDIKLIHFSNPVGLDPEDPSGKDDVVTANELHLPVNVPTVINMTSKDVIHSFFVPEFRVKQDIVPGMKTSVWVQPTMEGKFELACAQLCGFGHNLMRGDVMVESDKNYKLWLVSRSASGGK